MTDVAIINYGAQHDYPAMLHELAGGLHVYSHNPLAHTAGLGSYEHVQDCEFVPYAELRIRQLARTRRFAHVITDNEYDLERAARIREDLGIPGQSVRSARQFRDKVVMKQTAGRTVATPRYARLKTIVDLTRFIEENDYPVVVKPVSQGGSRDVVVLRDEDGLMEFSRRHWREDLMVEDFVEGEIYHVDAILAPGYRFVASSRYLRDCLGVLSGHNNGSLQLDPAGKPAQRLEEFLDRVLEAFDTPEVGAYHLEVFRTPEDEFVLCEIASRVGGSRIPALTRLTYGIDLHATWLRLSCGLPVDPAPTAPPAELRGSIGIVPQGRPVRAPRTLPFDWVEHYQVNEQLAPGAVAQNSTSHLCFALVRGADTAEVEQRLLQVEEWILDNLTEADEPARTPAP
ncbi:ATP-grasp domain-containing protein [Streptomyces flavotricini]|uniref:ATP-grasp domain-containing protein n=1 Tax=Streptomyces flavotricini TaxID=66888 RepID=A0ABS8EF60_9ACTN|nr:ATP-grasp domain-containing protein [Streptomyces flavotricini]MCC0099508.1 ATP-grasp domain-containing protein [Streptomyces flavotricini]